MRAQSDTDLGPKIKACREASGKRYGAVKVWYDLAAEGEDVARCTVVRLMKEMRIQGVIRGKGKKTTYRDPAQPCPEDKVNRDFMAPAPNVLWVADFTYVRTAVGFVYVAFIIDVFARHIVGWQVSSSPNTKLVLDALEQALGRCKPCRAYIIASPGSGIHRQLLSWLFPGCQLRKWQPVPEKLKGNVQRAIAQIDETFGEFCADVMTYKELCDDLDKMDVRNFRRTVRKRESFQKALQDRDLEETEIVENGRTLKGIQRVPNPFPVEEEDSGDMCADHSG